MASALAITTPGFMQPAQWQMMTQQAEILHKSGFLPSTIKNPQQAIAVIMVGYELGIQPWQALSTINVIQGKPTISPQLMLALIQRSKQLESMSVDGNNQQCTVTMARKGQGSHTETFTLEDAKKMGLAGKDNWLKQPGTMLKWRAMAACARVLFPDVILGLYTDDEMGSEPVENDAPKLEVVKVETVDVDAEGVERSSTEVGQSPTPRKGEIVEEAPLVDQPQPAPAKPERRIDTKPANGKPESLFQYLMKTIDHMRYTDSKARAGAITKLQDADILFDRMDRGEAVKLVNVYADLRDDGEESSDAIEAVRKLVNKQAAE